MIENLELKNLYQSFLLVNSKFSSSHTISDDEKEFLETDEINDIIGSFLATDLANYILSKKSAPSQKSTESGTEFKKELFVFDPGEFKEAVECCVRLMPKDVIDKIRNVAAVESALEQLQKAVMTDMAEKLDHDIMDQGKSFQEKVNDYHDDKMLEEVMKHHEDSDHEITIKIPKGFMNVGIGTNNYFIADTNNSANWDTLIFPLPDGPWKILRQDTKNNTVTLVKL